jgi:hypothetical protein
MLGAPLALTIGDASRGEGDAIPVAAATKNRLRAAIGRILTRLDVMIRSLPSRGKPIRLSSYQPPLLLVQPASDIQFLLADALRNTRVVSRHWALSP